MKFCLLFHLVWEMPQVTWVTIVSVDIFKDIIFMQLDNAIRLWLVPRKAMEMETEMLQTEIPMGQSKGHWERVYNGHDGRNWELELVYGN